MFFFIEEVIVIICCECFVLVFVLYVEILVGIILFEDYIKVLVEVIYEVGGLFVIDCIVLGCVWLDMYLFGIDVLIFVL